MSLWDDFLEYFTFVKGHPPKMKILSQQKVTPEITEWSKKLVFSPNEYPMGAMVQKDFNGLQVVGRIEHHTWSHDKSGKKIYGNFRGITLYEIT